MYSSIELIVRNNTTYQLGAEARPQHFEAERLALLGVAAGVLCRQDEARAGAQPRREIGATDMQEGQHKTSLKTNIRHIFKRDWYFLVTFRYKALVHKLSKFPRVLFLEYSTPV